MLMFALLIYLDGGALFWAAILGAVLHELGHYAAARFCGVNIKRLNLTASGAEMELSTVRSVPYIQELFITLAGPAINLAGAVLLAHAPTSWESRYLHAGVQLSLGAFNLLPLYPLDGGAVVRIFLSFLLGEERGTALARAISVFLSMLVFLTGAFLVGTGRASISLLVTGTWLLLRNLGNPSIA